MGLRNSRVFKFRETVEAAWDLLTDSEPLPAPQRPSSPGDGQPGHPSGQSRALGSTRKVPLPARATAATLPSFHLCHLFSPIPGLIRVLPR